MPGMSTQNLVTILIAAKYTAGKEFKAASKDLETLKSSLNKVSKTAVIAGKALGASLFIVAQQTAKYGDEAKKFERATGVQANTLASLRYAIQRWGGTQRDADTALRRFSKAIGDAAGGLDSYVRQFERLGMTQADLVGPGGTLKSIDELLPIVADAFRDLNDDVMAATVAQILFGRSGLRMLPAFKQGAKGLQDLTDRAEKLGILFSRELLEAAEDFQDAMLDVKESARGAMFALGEQLMPTITRLGVEMTNNVIKIREWIEEHENLGRILGSVTIGLIGPGGFVLAAGAAVAITKKLALAFKVPLGPAALLMLGVSALTAAIVYYKAKAAELPDTEKEMWEELSRLKKEMKPLEKLLYGVTEGTENYRQAIKRLKESEEFTEQTAGKELDKKAKKLEAMMRRYVYISNLLNDIRNGTLDLDAAERALAKAQEERHRKMVENITRLQTTVKDMEFDYRLSIGAETYTAAIERQKQKIIELTKTREEQIQTASEVGKNTELEEQYTEELMTTVAELIEAKTRLVTLEDEYAELVNKTADGLDRQTEAMARLEEENARLQEEMEAMMQMREQMAVSMADIDAVFQAGFSSMFMGIMQSAENFGGMFKRFWIGLSSAVLAIVARMVAKAVAAFIVMKMAANFLPIPFIGAPIVSIFSNLAQSGGEVTSGMVGRDTVPMVLGRKENILDHTTNDRLKAFLTAAEGGAIGGGANVTINAGVLMATEDDAYTFGRVVGETSENYEDVYIARGIL